MKNEIISCIQYEDLDIFNLPFPDLHDYIERYIHYLKKGHQY